MTDLFNHSDAWISKCGLYRYLLTRTWGEGQPVTWVMLNPSTADASLDDPTIRRCIAFSRLWGYGGLRVVNLFAYRATNPKLLPKVADPVGPDNNQAIRDAVNGCDIVAAWGKGGSLRERDIAVLNNILDDREILCLGMNGDGSPKHPLYLAAQTRLVPYRPGEST
jgi:hypothetical protein